MAGRPVVDYDADEPARAVPAAEAVAVLHPPDSRRRYRVAGDAEGGADGVRHGGRERRPAASPPEPQGIYGRRGELERDGAGARPTG